MNRERRDRLKALLVQVHRLDPKYVDMEWSDGRGAPVAHVDGRRYTDASGAGLCPEGLYEIVDDESGSFVNRPIVAIS